MAQRACETRLNRKQIILKDLLKAANQGNVGPQLRADPERWKQIAKACLAIVGSNAQRFLAGVLPGGYNQAMAAQGTDWCERPTMPWFIMGSDYDQASGHAYQSIFGGGGVSPNLDWLTLHYEYSGGSNSGGKFQLQDRDWFKRPGKHTSFPSACKQPIANAAANGLPKLACDEFPFFATEEGGQFHRGALPHIKAIDSAENSASGGVYGNFTVRCGLQRGTIPTTATSNAQGGEAFFVVPAPSQRQRADTFGLASAAIPPSLLTFGVCNRPKPGGGGVS